ncbi:hypothetical protein IKE67_10030 [bacterium]|nr:hypothetical protein [bacterium]
MNKFEESIETLINSAEYNNLLKLIDKPEYKQNLIEEDYFFYKSYCLCKLGKAKEALQYFVKVLSINKSLKYKILIYNLLDDIFVNGDSTFYDGIEFVKNINKIFPIDGNDIFIIKICQYFYYSGFFSTEDVIEMTDKFLNNNKTNYEIYEIRADIFQNIDDKASAIENLQTAMLLNKNAKKRYLEKINFLKE